MKPSGSGTGQAYGGQAGASSEAALGGLGIVPVAVIDNVGDAAMGP